MNAPLEEFVYHCRRECAFDDVDEYVAWYIRHAHCYSGPDCFAMAVRCSSDEVRQGWIPPRPPGAVKDCWFVGGVAGNLAAAWAHLPSSMPWVAFYRSHRGQKRLAILPIGRLKQLCHMQT